MCLGIPGQVLDVLEAGDASEMAEHLAAVRVSGARRMVDLSLVDEEGIAPGDWVLVHAGLALSKIPEEEAQATLALLQEMSDAFLELSSSGDPNGEPGAEPAPPSTPLTANTRGDYATPNERHANADRSANRQRRARAAR